MVTLLLVEDEGIVALATARRLQKMGYRVVIACSGEAAVEKARNEGPFDLVLMDIDLGEGMDGAEAAQRILAERDVPLVFLSSHSEAQMVEKTEAITSYGYVTKQSEDAVLLASIRMAFKLHEAKRQLAYQAALLEQVSDAVIATGLDLRVVAWNAAATRLYGWTAGEAQGQVLDELLQTEFIGLTQAEAQAALQRSGTWKGEIRSRTKDGRWLDVDASVTQVRDAAGQVVGGVTINRDITARVQASLALRSSERRYRTLVEISPDPIALTDLHGRFLTVNQAGLELYGYDSLEQLQGQGLTSFDMLVEEDRPRAYYNALKVVEMGAVRNVEYRSRRRDGSILSIEISAALLLNEQGNPEAFLAVVHDISQRQQAEEAQARTLSEKSLLLKDLQHRIKNSLILIRSLISLEMGYNPQPETQAVLADLLGRVTSLVDLYATLNDSGEVRQVQLDRYLERIVQSLSGSFLHGRTDVQVSVVCEPLQLDARQATPYGLILNELLTNAFKYAFPDERTGRVWVELQRVEGQVVLTVGNDGVLPPPDFDPWRSGGMGMQIVQMLALQLEGSVTYQSNGRTSFVIRAPYLQP